MQYGIGIDIGSTSAKTAVADQNRQILLTEVRPTGWNSRNTAEEILLHLSAEGYCPPAARIVATGYGRVSVPGAAKTVTEISCHAVGATHVYNLEDFIVIDIGGQDTKIIRVSGGKARDFRMNDKCSAGTGRFLEVMAGAMGAGPGELCELARAGSGVRISSLCTVFAESEVIGLVGRGEPKQNIAFAIVDSIVDKVASQAAAFLDGDTPVCLTGGLCDELYLVESLSEKLHRPIETSPEARFAGAIGAALLAVPQQ